jgi:hypothetical protein
MPESLRLTVLLALQAWAIWYFSKLVWVSLISGTLMDSDPRLAWDGRQVTRDGKPIAFWFAIVLSGLFTCGFVAGSIAAAGELLGVWESGL